MASVTSIRSTGRVFGNVAAADSVDPAPVQERAKATVWLNIGGVKQITFQDGGETVTEDVFVSLPFGVPFDAMKRHVIKGDLKSPKNLRLAAENQLMDLIEQAAAATQPGSTRIFKTLQVQLRRVAEETEVTAEDNASNPFGFNVSADEL